MSSSATSARARILDGAIRRIADEGAAGASMAAIATTAGVSKALLHYHFADRARLLAEVVLELGARLERRERTIMDGADGRRVVDALWSWLGAELVRGELRALVELALLRDPEVRAASDTATARRRQAATGSVERIFAGLGLTPRLPAELLGSAHVAFVDGLSAGRAGAHGDVRASFDVFWLALLSLAEQEE